VEKLGSRGRRSSNAECSQRTEHQSSNNAGKQIASKPARVAATSSTPPAPPGIPLGATPQPVHELRFMCLCRTPPPPPRPPPRPAVFAIVFLSTPPPRGLHLSCTSPSCTYGSSPLLDHHLADKEVLSLVRYDAAVDGPPASGSCGVPLPLPHQHIQRLYQGRVSTPMLKPSESGASSSHTGFFSLRGRSMTPREA
jgi:hypothetical protein